MSKSPQISVVVCTHNRADRLRPCLESLAAQHLPPAEFEIVLVDDGSADATPNIAAEFVTRMPNLRAIRQNNAGLGAARERGWRACSAPIVAFLDDDAEASPEWLEVALDRFLRNAVKPHPPVVLGGPTRGRWETKRPVWLNEQLASWLTVWKPYPDYRESSVDHLFVGANMIFLRSALEQTGGFNPKLGRKGRGLLSHEESELWSRMAESGHVAAYEPRLWVWHYVPSERCRRAWFWRRIYWEGVSLTRAHRLAGDARHPLRAGGIVLRAFGSRIFLRQLLRPWTWKATADGWFHLAYSLGCAREWLRQN